WPPEGSFNLRDYISISSDSDLIMPFNFCKKKSLVTIFVTSSLRGFSKRQVIRDTWGNTSHFNYTEFFKMHGNLTGNCDPILESRLRFYSEYLSFENNSLRAFVNVVFIVGRNKDSSPETDTTMKKLQKEAEQHNDILQEDFVDTYQNLTLKSMHALKHFNKHCSNSSAYFFKTDDDSFINIPNFIHVLLGGTVPNYEPQCEVQHRLAATRGILLGRKYVAALPIRHVCSQFYLPLYIYPEVYLPTYLSGSGYLMSSDVVERLYKTAWSTKINPMEDVFITGLVSAAAKVEITHNPLFQDGEIYEISCALKGIILQHKATERRMIEIWKYVLNYQVNC
ncbi:hypothetical protein KR018_001058, partial [Drosophila ironensis]